MKSNGVAYSGVRKNSKHDPNERAIHIKVGNTVNPHKNATSAHEYFHLIQYGTTYYRNRWFLEGMARWSQDVVSKEKTYPDGKDIPTKLNSKFFEEQTFAGSYKVAGTLWFPLAAYMNDKATIPDSVMKKYRYVDGSPVFQDNIIYGPNVMREVMLKMKSKEDLGVTAGGFANAKDWHKNGQSSVTNNKIMMDCVKEVYNSKG